MDNNKLNSPVQNHALLADDQLGAPKKIYQWLSAPDSSKNYHDARKQHQKDTCSWFLNGAHFREFHKKANFLWIKGKAGSGKTILCSSIINKIISFRNANPSTTYYAYFFFDGRDSRKDLQLHDKLIRSLIWQLSIQCDCIPAPLVDLYGHGDQQPSTDSLEDILSHIIIRLPTAYIIIDSLDECIDRQQTLHWLEQILSRKIGGLHMAVVSRPERDIEDALQLLDASSIDLAKESSKDIMRYLDEQLPGPGKWDGETRDIVKSTLTKRSDGMFRWVALQLIELKKCSSRESVMKQLNLLPGDLYETYDRILLKVNEADRSDTKTFLWWLCFSTRSMKLSEIAEAVAIDFDAKDGPHYNPSRRYWDERDVLDKCSGFIIESKEVIKLAHFSVKEYLLSNHVHTSTSLNSYWTTAELCHSFISQTCLAYLQQFETEDSVDHNVAVSSPLASYAAEHWIFHAKAGDIEKSDSSRTLTLATNFFTHARAVLKNWIRICYVNNTYYLHHREKYGKQGPIAPPLYYMSLGGLYQACLRLLKEANPNAEGGFYGNALQAASSQGHKTIVEVLLEKQADPNAEGGFYGNALQAASSQGHKEIVEVLLEKGANPDAEGKPGNTLHLYWDRHEPIMEELKSWWHLDTQSKEHGNALQRASYQGHKAIVEVLLEKRADPNAQRGKYGNALQTASYRGHQAIVEVLLAKGADPHAQGGQYGNALQAASRKGHKAIVEVLLAKGLDPNTQGGSLGNALQAASYRGHQAIVEVLLKKGADPNAQGGQYGNALQAASSRGHQAIVELLLNKGPDPNTQGGCFSNALYAASLKRHKRIVEVLLAKGADPNAQGGRCGNALQAASMEGDCVIVEVLLTKGADPNAQGGFFGNALYVASLKGHKRIVELLLAKGANPNAQGGQCGNALQAASLEGDRAIAEVLLANGADPNTQGGEYGNALQAASLEGHWEMVEVLLAKGVDLNAQGGFFGNALQAASYRGHQAIVEVLAKGADPNMQGGFFGNALQAASYGGYKAVVKVLLVKGADPNAQGGQYGNALQAASKKGHKAIVEVLLAKGADPNTQGGEYGNALQAASFEGHRAMVEVLLEKGADPNAQGGFFGNALQAASYGGHKAVVNVLLAKGADPKAQGGKYGNALRAASRKGHKAVVEMLLAKGAHNAVSS